MKPFPVWHDILKGDSVALQGKSGVVRFNFANGSHVEVTPVDGGVQVRGVNNQASSQLVIRAGCANTVDVTMEF